MKLNFQKIVKRNKKINMKNFKKFIIGISIIVFAAIFWFLVFKSLPIGIFLVIIGAHFAVSGNFANNKISFYIGNFGSFLYPVGIIITFIYNGWIWGILSIFIGLMAYSYAKSTVLKSNNIN